MKKHQIKASKPSNNALLPVAHRAALTSTVCFILSACSGGDNPDDPIVDITPTPIATPSPTPTPTDSLLSDFNHDGCVGYADYDLFLENYGLEVNKEREIFDTNKDGDIDFSDYAILLQDWGNACVASYGPVQPQEFTFVVEITDADFNHQCSAAILDASWVLSLASCLGSGETKDLRIVTTRLDESETPEASEIHNIEKRVYFPSDSNQTKEQDLVMVKVEEAFVFSAALSPIAVNTQVLQQGESMLTAGWGMVNNTPSSTPTALHYIDLVKETCENLQDIAEVPKSCVRAKDDSFLFSYIDAGAPIFKLEEAGASFKGLGYRLSGFAVTTDSPNSSFASMAELATDDSRIIRWIEQTLARESVYGDIDGDGCVGDADYQLYLVNNGRDAADAEPPEADVNSDGVVNFDDYAVLLQTWGQGCSE